MRNTHIPPMFWDPEATRDLFVQEAAPQPPPPFYVNYLGEQKREHDHPETPTAERAPFVTRETPPVGNRPEQDLPSGEDAERVLRFLDFGVSDHQVEILLHPGSRVFYMGQEPRGPSKLRRAIEELVALAIEQEFSEHLFMSNPQPLPAFGNELPKRPGAKTYRVRGCHKNPDAILVELTAGNEGDDLTCIELIGEILDADDECRSWIILSGDQRSLSQVDRELTEYLKRFDFEVAIHVTGPMEKDRDWWG